jgi:hypothetical protein
MFYLLKAAFWLGLVFLLLPDPAPQAPGGWAAAPTGEGVATAVIQGAVQGAAALCRDHAVTCARGVATVTDAAQRGIVRSLTERPQDTLTPSDLGVPFGGLAVPTGSAPKTAPLPPRRPA